MSSPRTFKHTPKEERDAARQQAKGNRRRASQAKKTLEKPARAASPRKSVAQKSTSSKPATRKVNSAGARCSDAKKAKTEVGILPWVLGGVGLLALILILAVAAGGDSDMPDSQTRLRTPARTGKTDRMANQRYNELDGKTIKEWMGEQDETGMARERRERREEHKGRN